MIQKFSARQPSLEIRLKVLKGIASEIGVALYLEEDAPVIAEVGNFVNYIMTTTCTNRVLIINFQLINAGETGCQPEAEAV